MSVYKFVYTNSDFTNEDLSSSDASITFEVKGEDLTIHSLIEHFERFLLATGYGELLNKKFIDIVAR